MTETGVVAVVDDDGAARTSLLRLLGVAGYATRGYGSAVELLQERAPLACVVTDLQMPGMTGLDLQRTLRDRGQEVPLVFVTGFGTVPVGVQAMREGAVDFLEKPADPGALLEAVSRAVARGATAMARRTQREEVVQRLALLTPREREVFDAVVQGWPNKQVAASLGIALKTVKVHRGRVMQKMGAGSVADLVRASELLGG